MKAEELLSVAGKVVAVTGGANGLGLAIAGAMADNGARVVVLDADASEGAAAADALSKRGAARFVRLDVTDLDGCTAAFEGIAATEGGLDVLFANAAIVAGPGFLDRHGQRVEAGAIENIPLALWSSVIDVNLTGVFHTIRAAVPWLKQAGQGGHGKRIVVTTSIAAEKPSPGVGTPYLAAKAAVAHLVRQLGLELARFGITVNAIQPGPFKTRITTPDMAAIFVANSPSKRIAEPHEIEGLALFFASDASGFVTGAQFPVDGGRLLGTAD